MKKKLALLLVLSLLLSAIPMNAFGAHLPALPGNSLGTANPVVSSYNENVEVTVNLDLSRFVNEYLTGDTLPLSVEITGDSRIKGLSLGAWTGTVGGVEYNTVLEADRYNTVPINPGAGKWVLPNPIFADTIPSSAGNVGYGGTRYTQTVSAFPLYRGIGDFEVQYWRNGGTDSKTGTLTLRYLRGNGDASLSELAAGSIHTNADIDSMPTVGTIPANYIVNYPGAASPFLNNIYPGVFNIGDTTTGAPIQFGQTSIPITFHLDIRGSSNIIIKFAHNDSVVVNTPVSSIQGGGINIPDVDKVYFHSTTLLPDIKIAENRRGAIDASVTNNNINRIELELPRYYKWFLGEVQSNYPTTIKSDRGTFTNITTGGRALNSDSRWNSSWTTVLSANGRPWGANPAAPFAWGTDPSKITGTNSAGDPRVGNWHVETFDNGLRERLVIYVDAARETGGVVNTLPDTIILQNLWITAEDRAPMDSDVVVSVHAKTINYGAGGNGNSTQKNLTVAHRTGNDLTLSVYDNKPLEVRTGSLGGDIKLATDNSLNVSADANGGRYYYEGVKTATVILKETTPNSWGSTFGTATEFSFDDSSIRILGARVWLVNDSAKGQWGQDGVGWNWQGWMNARNGQYPTTVNSATLSPSMLRVFYPTQNVTDVTKRRELRAEFFLSIEAGYEHKYGEEIQLTVKGAGAANLKPEDSVVTVALARDPIDVSNNGPVQVPTGTTYFTGKTNITDITITESTAKDERLEVNDEIWVYVIGDGRRQDVTFTCDPRPVINSGEKSGLRLRDGVRLHHPQPNFWLDGMTFLVERESWGEEPASFTLTNCSISGNIYPGVEYIVVVSGPGVASNDQYVLAARAGVGEGGQLSNLTAGAFYKDPYTVPAVTFSEIGGDNAPGGSNVTGPGTGTVIVNPGLTTLPTLFTNQPTASGVENSLIFRKNTTGTTDVGYVSVAAFLDLLRAFYGENAVPTNDEAWNDATQTATIYGPHKDGRNVTVVLTVGSTNITIDGTTVDIADSVGGASGPSGTIRVINENFRNYLPLRSLSQAFGWVPTWEGNGTAVTFK